MNLQELPWVAHAECKYHQHVDFFPVSRTGYMKAKAICRVCPVRVDCLNWALEHEFYGVWGGTSEKERRTLRRQKRRPPQRYPQPPNGTMSGPGTAATARVPVRA